MEQREVMEPWSAVVTNNADPEGRVSVGLTKGDVRPVPRKTLRAGGRL